MRQNMIINQSNITLLFIQFTLSVHLLKMNSNYSIDNFLIVRNANMLSTYELSSSIMCSNSKFCIAELNTVKSISEFTYYVKLKGYLEIHLLLSRSIPSHSENTERSKTCYMLVTTW